MGSFPWQPIQPQLSSLDGKIVYYCYALVFFGVFLTALIQLVRFCRQADKSAIGPQIVFYAFITVSLLCRVLYFILDATLGLTSYVFGFSVLPGVVFFSTYLLLAGVWVGHGYASRDDSSPLEGRVPYIVTNSITYGVFIALFIPDVIFWGSPLGDKLTESLLLLDGSLNVVVGLAFFVLGGRVYWTLKHVPVRSTIAERRMFKMGVLTLICTVVLEIRAALIIWGALGEVNFSTVGFFIFEGCFYMFLEITPIILMMIALGPVPPSNINPVAAHSGTYLPLSDSDRQKQCMLKQEQHHHAPGCSASYHAHGVSPVSVYASSPSPSYGSFTVSASVKSHVSDLSHVFQPSHSHQGSAK
eukprot:TRINITY_DN42_c0_g1_i1.p1 TRINITY_DN42_c0_g1~~TRINITY_DN42_c0_g1_i1.p1  ORF type:complete len:358 (+),score=37.82 TRINITY_DN42_c0_g1_i1:102-1175(+)